MDNANNGPRSLLLVGGEQYYYLENDQNLQMITSQNSKMQSKVLFMLLLALLALVMPVTAIPSTLGRPKLLKAIQGPKHVPQETVCGIYDHQYKNFAMVHPSFMRKGGLCNRHVFIIGPTGEIIAPRVVGICERCKRNQIMLSQTAFRYITPAGGSKPVKVEYIKPF